MKRQPTQEGAGKAKRGQSVPAQSTEAKAGRQTTKKKVVKSVLAKRAVRGKGGDQSTTQKDSPKKPINFSNQRAGAKRTLELIETVRTGIPFVEFQKLVETMPFTMDQWAEFLHVSLRTLQRARKDDLAFQALQAERIIEIVTLYTHGMEVFSNQDKLNKWMGTSTAAMGGKAPQELLDTKLGIGLVNDELGRLEHGILA